MKTESLQVISKKNYFFLLASWRRRLDFCDLILHILLKACPQVNQSWEVVPRKLDQFVWRLSVMKAKADHSFGSWHANHWDQLNCEFECLDIQVVFIDCRREQDHRRLSCVFNCWIKFLSGNLTKCVEQGRQERVRDRDRVCTFAFCHSVARSLVKDDEFRHLRDRKDGAQGFDFWLEVDAVCLRYFWQKRVCRGWKITLHPEVHFVGDFQDGGFPCGPLWWVSSVSAVT